MKIAIVFLLFFISWWGFIGYGLLMFYDTNPNSISNKWYIAIPLFILAVVWGVFMQDVARRYRNKK